MRCKLVMNSALILLGLILWLPANTWAAAVATRCDKACHFTCSDGIDRCLDIKYDCCKTAATVCGNQGGHGGTAQCTPSKNEQIRFEMEGALDNLKQSGQPATAK